MRNRTLLQIVKSYVYLIRGGGGKARGVAGYRAGWTAFPEYRKISISIAECNRI